MNREQLAARSDALADMDAEVGGPYVTAVSVTAEPENPKSAPEHVPWIRPLRDYERQETTIVEGPRYG
jgi:hypothetical protein